MKFRSIYAAIACFIIAVAMTLYGIAANCDELTMDTRYTPEQTRHGLEAARAIKGDIAKEADFVALARAFYAAQEEFNIPSLFLVSIGWHESRYGMDRVGKIGERGILQVAKKGRRR